MPAGTAGAEGIRSFGQDRRGHGQSCSQRSAPRSRSAWRRRRAAIVTRVRHRAALEACLAALRRFGDARLPELAAEDFRAAARSLGRITGRVDVEDMLDRLFAQFCIGK